MRQSTRRRTKTRKRLPVRGKARIVVMLGCMLVAVLVSIVAVIQLDQTDRRRLDASRVVAGVVSTADQLLFLEWQGLTGTVPSATVHARVFGLLDQIDSDLTSLRSDGVEAATVTQLGNAVHAYTKAIVGDSVKVASGQLNLFAGGPLTVLSTYETIHTASDRAQATIDADANRATLIQDVGTIVLIVAVCGVVTALVAREQRRRNAVVVAQAETDTLRSSEEKFRLLFERNPHPMWVFDPDSLDIVMVNEAAVGFYGWRREDFLAMPVTALFSGDDVSAHTVATLEAEADRAGKAPAQHRLKDGRVIDVELSADRLHIDGRDGVLLLAQDVTERNRLEQQLRHQAFHDPLTGLPNRALFRERVHHAVLRSRRSKLHCAAILLDLDDFKTVNDSLGHTAGDDLLVQVAQRIPGVIRPGDTVARLGGDEFAVLVEDMQAVDEVSALADRLGTALAEPFRVSDLEVHVSASIGVAFAGDERDCTPDDLIRDADVAMYAAKSRGEGGWALFGADMHEHVQQRLALRSSLSRVTENRELVVHYQPVLNLEACRVTGVEALVRWDHPVRGLIPPSDFIHVAEETGGIRAIGRYVLSEAAQQIRRWQDRFPTDAPLELSVNVSFRELVSTDFVEQTLQILDSAGLDAHQLILEMTETMLMQDAERTIGSLDRLRRHGIRVAMDDFGTGYSSLTQLRQLPLDMVKIDRSFVASLHDRHEGLSMTLAIVRLLSTLDVVTVAEGIETAEQLAYVSAMGCERGQGYLFAPPLPADRIDGLLISRDIRPGGSPFPTASDDAVA